MGAINTINSVITVITDITGKIDDVDYSYAISYQYDINGNITNKSDVGDYS
jgi:hypothetical protein